MRTPSFFPRDGLPSNTLILAVIGFVALFGNGAFVANILKAYPFSAGNALAVLSLAAVFGGVGVLLLAPLCFRRSTKPVLITVLLLSAAAAYFMDTYGIVFSDDMLRNITHTHAAEVLELFTPRLFAYLLLLGVLPALAVGRVRLRPQTPGAEVIARLKLGGTALALAIGTVLAFGGFYASFFREHRDLRQHANPVYFLYSSVKYTAELFRSATVGPIEAIAADAAIPATDVSRELVIMVVGETARADRFSLNGYARDTNPRLREKNVISFTNFRACGTSTAVSVPCMFLLDGEAKGAAAITRQENLLDVLQRSGVNVLWRDNNSDSKGVANRVEYQDYKSPAVNPLCDNTECRDEGMLAGLQQYIDAHPTGDIFIVLHQVGNHGPAYFRRYPPEFEKFRPVCRESDLSRCSREEIGNAYDNAILYTDHFLAKAIELLQKNDNGFETALFYVSDHGESLGENGLYLHGLPKAIAPDAQLHVPAVMWFGRHFHAAGPQTLRGTSGMPFTHNNVFHTLLGFFEVQSGTYVAGMDMLNAARPSPATATVRLSQTGADFPSPRSHGVH
jgi:lipid A ethanolaminephosphotransferase